MAAHVLLSGTLHAKLDPEEIDRAIAKGLAAGRRPMTDKERSLRQGSSRAIADKSFMRHLTLLDFLKRLVPIGQ
jgi:hypothetical protein